MNYIDIILIIPIAYGLIQGLRKGLIKEICGLLAIVVGIYIARYFSLQVSDYISELTKWNDNICIPLAYALVFILVVSLIHMFAWIISKVLGVIMLGWLNRILGGIFGMFKITLLLSVILAFLNVLNDFVPIKENKAVKESLLYIPIEKTMTELMPFLNFEDFKATVENMIVDPITETVENITKSI